MYRPWNIVLSKMLKISFLMIITTAIVISYPYVVLIISIFGSFLSPSMVPRFDRPALGIRIIFLASALVILRFIIRRLCFSMHIAISFLSEIHGLISPSKIAALTLLGLVLIFPNFPKKALSKRFEVYPIGSCCLIS